MALVHRFRKLLPVLAVALGVVAAATGTTAAAPAGTAAFAAQTRAAGLTAAQAASLQRQVDRIIDSEGGRQVAANEIALPHGSSALLPLPGHTYAQVLPGAVNLGFAPAGSAAPSSTVSTRPEPSGYTPATTGSSGDTGTTWTWNGDSCSYHYVCMWSGQNASGTQWNVSTCNEDQTAPPWVGYGSWINNQTPGTRAYFKGSSHNLLYTTPAPVYWNSDYNWLPIFYVDACN